MARRGRLPAAGPPRAAGGRDPQVVRRAPRQFLTETAVTRDKAERARVAAGWKGIDLDDTSDRVTAQEWLDAHQLEQAAAEAEEPITEDDLAGDLDRSHPASVGEAVAPDLRDISEPDATERADPAVRRRVPPPDVTAAAVDRAERLMADVAARREAEQAAAAHASELEPEEDQLRHELARLHALDHDADDHVDEMEARDAGAAVVSTLRPAQRSKSVGAGCDRGGDLTSSD